MDDEHLNPLTPNTAAFLDSLTFGDLGKQQQPTAMPPSAFFPVPGRDTPEDSSPDSLGNDAKPSRKSLHVSDDSDNDMTALGNHHKRKAAGNAQPHHHGDDDDDSSDNGHDDKRQHGDESRKGRRASGDKKTSGDKNDKMTKAQRRKEQNRAAQKAFRERREQRVKDLEEKVAELEQKSFGATVENENLRNILRRLQEENVALKQASFTFSMPVNGAPPAPSANGQQTPTQVSSNQAQNQTTAQSSVDWSQFATLNKTYPQVTKPPSPPPSVGGDSLRSIHELSPSLLPHRGSSTSTIDTPDSLVSMGSTGPSPPDSQRLPSLFSGNTPNVNSSSAQDSFRTGTSPLESTPSSVGGTNVEDVDALFRSFYPDGIDAVLANAATAINSGQHSLQPMQTQMPQYTFLGQKPGLTSYADTSSNALAKLFGDSTSYRDTTAIATQPGYHYHQNSLDATTSSQQQSTSNTGTQQSPNGQLSSQAAWSNLNQSSVNDFLASLNGGTGSADQADLLGNGEDEAFSRQLDQLIAQSGGTSPSAPFHVNNNTFSPTNYLNMSPSPLPSLSNSQSPRSGTDSTSNVTSPQSSDGKTGLVCSDRIVHVVGAGGRVMRPSEVWTRMGMHKEKDGELLIDELCDEMRSKATCSDGRRYMKIDDVEGMYRRRGERECEAAGKYDPLECQAKLNEVYLMKKGVDV